MMPLADRLKQLAQQTVDVIDCKKETPETRLRIIKAYMLGLVDGITTKDAGLDTCTRCGKETGAPSYVLGHPGLYCPKCSLELCRKSEGDCEGPVGKEPRIKTKDFPNPDEISKCSICGSGADLLNILTSEGRVLKLCSKCRKALDDPNVQEALHKG